MTDRSSLPLHALPDGEAELTVVLRLRWDDVAALGHEAARLAARHQRPVSLDEAASYRLRTRPAHAAPAPERATAAATPPAPVALAGRSPSDQARQAIEKINGSAEAPAASAETSLRAANGAERPGANGTERSGANGTERPAANGAERPGRHPSAMISAGGGSPRTGD
ncbi:hypothetical protein [Streptomyces sp. 549]|uniref:hypothetical protein n=1 Tax=Streptomyces sp. 549 TaxID=3049076 RepID=UPI0032E367CB